MKFLQHSRNASTYLLLMQAAFITLSSICFLSANAFADSKTTAVPYEIDKRPLPTKNDADSLLPLQVSTFKRVELEGDITEDDEIYGTYQSGELEVFLTAGVTDKAGDAQEGVRTAKEVLNESTPEPFKSTTESLKTDPAFFKVTEGDTASMAWSHGKYYFSVDSRDGTSALEQFIKAFPY